MKTSSVLRLSLLASLIFPFGQDTYGINPDTARIRHFNEKAYSYHNENMLDSSLNFANRALKSANILLMEEDVRSNPGYLRHVQKLKARALNHLSMAIKGKTPDAALDTLRMALKIMEQAGDLAEQANLYESIGSIYDFTFQNSLSLQAHSISVSLYREVGDRKGLAMALTSLGITQRYMGNYGEAMESMVESLKINRELNDSAAMAETLLAMGFVYLYVEQWENALQVQQEALDIYQGLNDSSGIARIYNDMGVVNMAAGNPQKSLKQHQAALKIRLNTREFYYIFASYTYIGNNYESMGNFASALKSYQSALEYTQKMGYSYSLADAHLNVGAALFELQDYKSSMEHFLTARQFSRDVEYRLGETQTAMKIAEIYDLRDDARNTLLWLQKAEKTAPKSEFMFLEDIYYGIAKAYAKLEDYRKAFENMELLNQVKDSVLKTDNLEKVTTLTNRLEFENRQTLQRESQEKMIRLKQAKIERQTILRNFILFGMFVILLLAVIYYVRYIEKNKLNRKLNKAFSDLKSTQAQLIHAEKMASLGEVTAGVAHEIQNPLNFVNNFSEVNTELLAELKQEADAVNLENVIAISDDLMLNEEKIRYHGKRADAIVRGMLQHSRSSKEEKAPANINQLADEYLKLAFHGMRAKDKSFQADFKTNFDMNLPEVPIYSQDMGRVMLNIINNAFYAVNKKRLSSGNDFKPKVSISTSLVKGRIVIRIKDNGDGIPEDVLKKIFLPFFTTKPTGEGTGLGLSMSYDIITKAHGGTLIVKTKEGEGTVFLIGLPY